MIKKEIPRKPRKHDLTPKEAGQKKIIPAIVKVKLTNDQILEEYKRMPFINRIAKMGASIHRVRSVVRLAGIA